MNEITKQIYNIIKENEKCMTLNEIYFLFSKRNDVAKYSDYKSMIRRHIYDQCVDRDLRSMHKEALFFSTMPKKTRGNQYGLIEWITTTNMINDIDSIIINNTLSINDTSDTIELDYINEKYDDELKFNVSYRIKRRYLLVIKALKKANYSCEIDENHYSFVRKSNERNYTEAHHLIPLMFQDEFEYSLDCLENIVSLCSNCHNQLHYGKYKKQLLEKLYKLKKEELQKSNINITLKKLCSYYNVDE